MFDVDARRAAQLQRLGRGLRRLPGAWRHRAHPAGRQVHRPRGDDDDRGRDRRRPTRTATRRRRPTVGGDRCAPTYAIEDGDAPLVITRKFDVTLEQLNAANTDHAELAEPVHRRHDQPARRPADCAGAVTTTTAAPAEPPSVLRDRPDPANLEGQRPLGSAEVGPAARRAGGASRRCPGGAASTGPTGGASRCTRGRRGSGWCRPRRVGGPSSSRSSPRRRASATAASMRALKRRVLSPSAGGSGAPNTTRVRPGSGPLHALAEDRAGAVDEHRHDRALRCAPTR